ncbi:MAG: hypothetical protein WDO16_19575 [Bacteroidota bacterium]
MRYLRKTLWGVGAIILLQVLKKLFDGVFPEATIFYHNLLSCTQVVVLLWLVIAIIAEWMNPGKKMQGKYLLFPFLILAVPEMLFTYWLHYPSRIPSFLTPTFRNYYGGTQRNIIQFDPRCSVYDSSLLYTLKPSSRFVFANYEFADSFYTNKMGLRDDENSLVRPEIICLGDSYAMGWGVGQDKTFPELISSISGKKVLNAAISSYGTARELKNLYRLDTSALQYIIIQYGRNDATENEQFVRHNYSLKLSPGETYYTSVNMHYWNKQWFPGKHFITMAKMYAGKTMQGFFKNKKSSATDSYTVRLHQSAMHFTDMLLRSSVDFKKTRVFVADINEKELMDNHFLDEVNTLAGQSPYKEHFNNNLVMVPVADTLTPDDYYILDDHLRPSGHQKIAARLINYMFH